MAKTITTECFSEEAIAGAREARQILLADLETNLSCDSNCVYCFRGGAPTGGPTDAIVDYPTALRRIDRLVEGGVRTINIIGGGEPLLYNSGGHSILDVISYIRHAKVQCEMFTNGLILGTPEACWARFRLTPEEVVSLLLQLNVTVFLKLHSLRRETYDALAGRQGLFEAFSRSLRLFVEGAYAGSDAPQLVCQCTLTRLNYGEIPELWRFVRDRGLQPSFELMRPSGRARGSEHVLTAPQAQSLFRMIAEIDATEYGQIWTPIPPYLGYTCDLNRFSCYVNVAGDVYNCESMAVLLGNIDRHGICQMIGGSRCLQKLRNIGEALDGNCRGCQHLREAACFGGCRGFAWEATGDPLASDPICWQNGKTAAGVRDVPGQRHG